MLALEIPTLLTLFLNTQISRQGQGLKIAQWLPLILGPTEDSYEASLIMLCIPTLLRLLLNTQTPRAGKGLKLHNSCL